MSDQKEQTVPEQPKAMPGTCVVYWEEPGAIRRDAVLVDADASDVATLKIAVPRTPSGTKNPSVPGGITKIDGIPFAPAPQQPGKGEPPLPAGKGWCLP